MITYVKVGNVFIWGTLLKGLRIEKDNLITIQHDGDDVGVRELKKNLKFGYPTEHAENASRILHNVFVNSMRPMRSEIRKALSYAPEPKEPSIKRRSPPIKFRLLGSANEAFKEFIAGDYRYILRKHDPTSEKHRLAYIKAFIMATQNPFLKPSEDKLIEFLDLLHSIDDPLLREYYETIWTFVHGSGTLKRIHDFIEKNAHDIISSIKDEFTAALRSYETGRTDVAREILKYAAGVRARMAEATLIINGELGSVSEGFSLISSNDPNDIVMGFLMVMEHMDDLDPDVRDRMFHNIRTAFEVRLEALNNPDLILPSHIARMPIIDKSDLIVQYITVVEDGYKDLLGALELIPAYANAIPKALAPDVVHDLTLPYLLAGGDKELVLKAYKAIGSAVLSPTRRALLIPLFYSVVDEEYDFKYPLERLLINARENKLVRDAYIALTKLVEINTGEVKRLLMNWLEEIKETIKLIVENVGI